MATFEIPLESDQESFVQETDLDGVTYRLEFRWNEREAEWYLTVRNADDEVLVGSRKVTTGALILRLAYSDELPPGDLLAINTFEDGQSSPGRYDLGSKIVLLYLNAAEFEPTNYGTAVDLGGFSMHAEMRMQSAAAKAVTAGVWNTAGGAWVAGLLQDFAFDTGGKLTYSGTVTKQVMVTATMNAYGIADRTYIAVAKNGASPGADEAMTDGAIAAVAEEILTVSRIIELAEGDYLQMYVKSDSSGNLTVPNAIVTVIG